MPDRNEEARVGLIDDTKVKQFEFRVTKEVFSFIKNGGKAEEALLGLALAMADMVDDEANGDIRNKFLVRSREGNVSIGGLLSREMSRDDAVLLAAHLAVAAGDFGALTVKRMNGIMGKRK